MTYRNHPTHKPLLKDAAAIAAALLLPCSLACTQTAATDSQSSTSSRICYLKGDSVWLAPADYAGSPSAKSDTGKSAKAKNPDTVPPAVAGGQNVPAPPQKTMSSKDVSSPQISPNGSAIAYT